MMELIFEFPFESMMGGKFNSFPPNTSFLEMLTSAFLQLGQKSDQSKCLRTLTSLLYTVPLSKDPIRITQISSLVIKIVS
jgi:hypothetical protein